MVWDGSKVFVSVVGKGLRRLGGWGEANSLAGPACYRGFSGPRVCRAVGSRQRMLASGRVKSQCT